MKGLGTLINVVTVLAGSGLGLWLGSRLPARNREVLTGGLGVVTLLIGLDMARATGNILIVLGSVLAGGLVGTALDLDGRLEAMGRAVERALLRASRGTRPAVAAERAERPEPAEVPRAGAAAGTPAGTGTGAGTGAGAGPVPAVVPAGSGPEDGRPEAEPGQAQAGGEGAIARGFIAASLLFCVGPMTVLGSIQDGLAGDYQLLAVKATLDGFASLAMAPALGPGVALSALTVLGVQGSLTLLAGLISPWISEPMLNELTAAGGALVVMIGLGLLDIRRLPVANFLPALVFAPLLARLAGQG
ncbi:DUF554 domain-containing protein [Thermaerobacter sp. PB12/4term]|uniref:DUF554 domain-containing protein n=1 Tax=Thermaerobacter sp. PB12/4term TaxID=2293838 RepID=UPI000E32C74F|nr:DUF554 domain-containing protein [Thermaerobacter sp. PB12/4term]QIA26605.1 DUF554 domain-containing protein [Thermaerobacter sp. PB12/4term]